MWCFLFIIVFVMTDRENFKWRLDVSTQEFGIPPYIKDVERAIDILFEFMPNDLIAQYCKEYGMATDVSEIFATSKFPSPVNMLIAGDNLLRLEKTQKKEVLDEIKKDLQGLRADGTRISDALAEINVAAMVGAHEDIEVNADTGVKGSHGKKNKDSDIKHIKSGWFFEVKNFEFGKSIKETKLSKNSIKVFSDPKNFGKQFQIEKGIPLEIGNQSEGSSISAEIGSLRSTHAEHIRKAYKKFSDDQNAVVVLYNVGFTNHAIQAIENWRNARDNADRIKAVIIIGALRPHEGYTRSTHTYYLEDDPTDTEAFLKSLD